MTKYMNAILERVLSQELGKQAVWMDDDRASGFDVTSREQGIQEIKNFMEQEGIKFREDFYTDGMYMAKGGMK